MRHALLLLRQSGTASLFRCWNQQGQQLEVVVRHETLEMNRRVGDNWRSYTNDELLSEIKLQLGIDPVSTDLIMKHLNESHSERTIQTIAALIQWLPANQQPPIQAVANRLLLEAQGLTEDELCA